MRSNSTSPFALGNRSERENFIKRHRPFFKRFPLVGRKAHDFELFAQAVDLLDKKAMPDVDYMQILLLREGMNRGGKRRYTTERILRDYTPGSPTDLSGEMR